MRLSSFVTLCLAWLVSCSAPVPTNSDSGAPIDSGTLAVDSGSAVPDAGEVAPTVGLLSPANDTTTNGSVSFQFVASPQTRASLLSLTTRSSRSCPRRTPSPSPVETSPKGRTPSEATLSGPPQSSLAA